MYRNQRKDSGSDRWAPISEIGPRAVHPIRENLAFGFDMIPVLERQIQDPDLNLRRRALNSMKEVLVDPRATVYLSDLDSVGAFHKLVKDDCAEIRGLLAEVFVSLTSSSNGRKFFAENGLHAQALALLDDTNDTVRKFILKALNQVASTILGAKMLSAAGAIHKLVSRITLEPMVNQAAVLRVLHCCMAYKVKPAVEADAVKYIIPLLESSSSKIRQNAAECIMDLGSDDKGREQIVQLGGVNRLLKLCEESDHVVVAKGLGALMMAVNCTEGKFAALENSAIAILLPLLKNNDTEIRVNCLQTLTELAEAPFGKRILKENIGKILEITVDPSPFVQEFANRAIDVIQSIST